MRFNQGGAASIKAIFWAIIALIVVIGVIIGTNAFLNRNPQRRFANNFIKTIIDNNATDSYNMLGKRLKVRFNKDQWATSVKSTSVSLENKKPKITNDVIPKDGTTLFGKNSQARTIDFKFTLSKTTSTIHVTVYKDKSTWSIGDLNSSL